MLRRLLVLAAVTMVATAASAPPPPAVLAPYIHNGQFDPGDYGWIRGLLADATAAQKQDQAAVTAWLKQCGDDELAASRAALRAQGVDPAHLTFSGYADPLCAAVASAPRLPAGTRFDDIQEALPQAHIAADTYLFAVDMAGASVIAPDIRAQLLQRPLTEQMLRRGFFWGQGEQKDAPVLSPIARAIVEARMFAAAAARDHANTEWLKHIVDSDGWPSVSKVGEPAAAQAWLLVQHADADPAFQHRVLTLMGPLEAAHDLPPRNYAYLYDRVMLKLAGKQRYATQTTCTGGKWMPLPLEDAASVDEWRRRAGLEPLGAYLAEVDRVTGPCPPNVIPPSSAKR